MGQKFNIVSLFFGMFLTTAAQAGCLQEQDIFMSCQIEGRNTEVVVCYNDHLASYSYGPIGGVPDLYLSEFIENLDYEPLSGAGSTVAESVTFYNESYSYQVVSGFNRPATGDGTARDYQSFGVVEVAQDGASINELQCMPDTVNFGSGPDIYDVKTNLRQTWDPLSETWVSDRYQWISVPLLQEEDQYEVPTDCVPRAEFGLNGLMMGDTLDKFGKLGSPEPMEDLTGAGPVDRMALIGADIYFFNNAVFSMSSTSPDWETPSGLRVGLTRGEVIRIFGRAPDGRDATSDMFAPQVCVDDGIYDREWSTLIEFGQDKRVERISFLSPSY